MIITVCTLVQNCCKGDEPCLWNTPRILDPRGSKTPEPIDIKFDRGDYIGDITPHAHFGISNPKRGGCMYAWNCHHLCLFLHPVTFLFLAHLYRDRTVWTIFVFYGSKDVFRRQLRLFWGANKIFKNNFHYFSQKTQNSLFPQCKISIGNNSGSIKDRVVKFA